MRVALKQGCFGIFIIPALSISNAFTEPPPTLNCILSDASDVKYTLLFVVALRSLIPTPAAALISKAPENVVLECRAKLFDAESQAKLVRERLMDLK